MSEARAQPDPNKSQRDEPLRLADDDNDGSTDAVSGSSTGTPRRRRSDSASSSKSPASSPSPTSRSDSFADGGTSTGGFDTMLGKLVITSGLVTEEEMELCNSLLEQSTNREDPQTLQDLLIDNDFVTQRQLDRLRVEFEAKRSSQRIPGYRIKEKLGSGAMATVFLARQLSLDRLVAIKVLPKKFSDNVKFIERFYQEGRAAAQLNHPNIVAAYDVGKAGDHHYFVMEYVNGETVYDKIVREKRVAEKQAIEIVVQVSKALQHAHEKGFIHRDIKPKNIMIAKNGTVKLADLGLARAVSDVDAAKAEAGRAYGTPYYISPEQIRGEVKIGSAADIYGLGATFYHMVTGRVPYEGRNPSSVMHKHLKEELTPPDHLNPKLSGGCAQVIEHMMAKSVKDRYRSAADLLQDLELIARGEPPHFAHRTLDITTIPTGAAVAEDKPVVMDIEKPSAFANPLFVTVFIAMLVSVAANIIFIILLVS